MIFRKPYDPDKDLTEEEREEKLRRFRENDFDKEDERAMIFAALKVFLPVVLGIFAVFIAVVALILLIWN